MSVRADHEARHPGVPVMRNRWRACRACHAQWALLNPETRRAAVARYNHSAKGAVARARYEGSVKGVITSARKVLNKSTQRHNADMEALSGLR